MKKTWFITGTSSGIGLSMTEQILEKGDNVFATLRHPDQLKGLQQKYPAQLHLSHLELTDKEEIRRTVDRAFSTLGHIDVVVSNAGYGLFGALEELSEQSIEHVVDVNLLGSIYLIRSVIPFMRKQENGGHVIQVSSEGGQYTYPGFSLYHATKWGIEGFIESIAKDLEPFKIHFTIAEPGPTGTNFGSSLVIADAMEAYGHTPVNEVRQLLSNGFGELDNVKRVAQVIIESTEQNQPPLRVAIGNVAITNVQSVLKERMQNTHYVRL